MRRHLSLVALLLAGATAQAGVVVHLAAKDLASGHSAEHEVFYAQDGMLRVDTLDDRGHVTQMSLVRDGVLWEVDVRKRSYSKLDKATLQAKMKMANDRLQAMLAGLPPERRAAFEQNMKRAQQSGSSYVWNDAGRTEQSGPYSCRVWEEKHADKVTAQYCVVAASKLPGGDELEVSLRKAYATVQDLFSGIPQMAAVADRFAKFNKMSGFPVLQRHIAGGKPYREELVQNIERQALPADKFAIPKGFTEVTPDGED